MIRPATPADSDAVGRLWERLVEYHRSLDADLPKASENGGVIYVQRLVSRADDSTTRVFVAEEDGEIVGYVLGVVIDLVPEMFVPETSGFLADIYVEPAFRGRGIGRGLVEALAGWFRSQGLPYYEWYVAVRNESGRQFWRQIGGRELMVRMRADL